MKKQLFNKEQNKINQTTLLQNISIYFYRLYFEIMTEKQILFYDNDLKHSLDLIFALRELEGR